MNSCILSSVYKTGEVISCKKIGARCFMTLQHLFWKVKHYALVITPLCVQTIMSGCYIQLHTIFRPLLLLHPGTYSHVLLLIVCDVLFLLKKNAGSARSCFSLWGISCYIWNMSAVKSWGLLFRWAELTSLARIFYELCLCSKVNIFILLVVQLLWVHGIWISSTTCIMTYINTVIWILVHIDICSKTTLF